MAFASADDVEMRLGRDLTDAEANQADLAIEIVSEMILEVAGTDEPSPAPAYYRALAIEKAIGAVTNPNSLAVESEGLGAYTSSRTFQRAGDVGIFLTEREEAMIGRIASGVVSGSSYPRSLPHETAVSEI